MSRFPSAKITPYIKPIQEFPADFYEQFHLIIAGLDNMEARRWINSMVHDLVKFDSNNNPDPAT